MALISGLRYLFAGNSIALAQSRGLCTSAQLFVGGLSFETNEQVLKDTFSHYGQLLEVRVLVNRDTGRSKGCGFVQFASKTEAENARKALDRKQLDGRNIRVEFANSRPPQIGGASPRAGGPPSNPNKESFIEGLDD